MIHYSLWHIKAHTHSYSIAIDCVPTVEVSVHGELKSSSALDPLTVYRWLTSDHLRFIGIANQQLANAVIGGPELSHDLLLPPQINRH